jgi:hypothetical protein
MAELRQDLLDSQERVDSGMLGEVAVGQVAQQKLFQ